MKRLFPDETLDLVAEVVPKKTEKLLPKRVAEMLLKRQEMVVPKAKGKEKMEENMLQKAMALGKASNQIKHLSSRK